MSAYGIFLAGVALVTLFVLVLAQLTQRQLTIREDGVVLVGEQRITTIQLYGNVFFSQLLIGGLILALLWVSAVPPTALAIDARIDVDLIALGLGLGIVLYLGNEASVHLLDRLGVAYSERLRTALTPTRGTGWVMLLGVVLPTIAVVEELLFRAAIIGAGIAGFGLDPILLVVLSAALFAIGHGAQGMGGILVTGVLGLVLGAAFVYWGSLLVVVVAHYVINVLEFIVHASPIPSRVRSLVVTR